MYQEIAKDWADSLRSGQYQQGFNRLRTEQNGYCCLGVLTARYIAKTGRGSWVPNPNSRCYNFVGDDGCNGLYSLPKEVIEWAGIKPGNTSCRIPAGVFFGYGCLSSINDSQEVDFKEIADLIEQHYQAL